jgi:transposase
MEAIVERACGLDVHQRTVVACVLRGTPTQRPQKEVRTFGTTTPELLALREWLEAGAITHVGMESTGVYWRPVYAVLEGGFQLLVGNAQHIKAVPGRKTDVKDSEWLAQLVRHGLIRPSVVLPRPLRALRDLVRARRKLIESRTTERNRLLKLLETANLKLASVVSDVFGVSGLRMLRALAAGAADPATLANEACGRLRAPRPALIAALTGRIEPHHRLLLGLHLDRLDQLALQLARLTAVIDEHLAPYAAAHARLQQIPGVGPEVAAVLLAELGDDMTVFGDVHHLAAWVGICPGNHESAGKHRSTHIRKGNVAVTTALVEAAQAATRTKGTYLREKFHRLRARRGYKRAIVAVGHKILIAAYHLLRGAATYRDLGPAYLDSRHTRDTVRQLTRRLQRLGFAVTLHPLAAP